MNTDHVVSLPLGKAAVTAEQPVVLHAQVVGEVTFRQGDGPHIVIPLGPCEVQLMANDATIAWEDGDAKGVAAMPLLDFKRFVRSGAIVMADTTPT
jgi:hypothetical protein